MKPLVFEFKESPDSEILDYSAIEYDEQLHLSVNKRTRQPAIDCLMMDTATFTKAQCEGADSDAEGVNMILDTGTRTYTQNEESDSDEDYKNIQVLMDTTTITESREDVDQDK